MANSIQQANEPTLASVLALYKQEIMSSINCHQVGEIVSFDLSTQTAEVQIKMLRMMNGELKQYPILLDCPCVVLGGGKGRITFPIEQGDSCLVLFNDKDIDNWYSGGQSVAPRTDRKHNFADAIALVGIRNKQNEIEDYLQHGVELKYGQSTIKLENNKVTITNNKSTITMDKDDITVNGNVNVIQNTVDDNSLHAYIISSYHSGASWYRVYSDGWCEQGGKVTPASGRASVILLKSYSDTNYTTNVTVLGDIDDFNIVACGVDSLSTTGFSLREGFANIPYNYPVMWVARGYIS